jgi:nicotinamidase-related amidase
MTTALLLVDVQRSMLEAPEPVPDAGTVSSAIKTVLDRARWWCG